MGKLRVPLFLILIQLVAVDCAAEEGNDLSDEFGCITENKTDYSSFAWAMYSFAVIETGCGGCGHVEIIPVFTLANSL